MKENVVQKKSYSFALRIVKLYRKLGEEKKEFVMAKQILCSGTSIGAKVEEAIGGQSERDFHAKMIIAYKEARETQKKAARIVSVFRMIRGWDKSFL